MTDRELLEFAAKAAGWTWWWWHSKHGYWNLKNSDGAEFTACHNWPAFDASTGKKLPEPTVYDALIEVGFDPENDSWQALELAVQLGLSIQPYPMYSPEKHSVEVSRLLPAPPSDDENTFVGPQVVEIYKRDPLAATRLAITRAAAENGKAMT
jgi:hypothetical protein